MNRNEDLSEPPRLLSSFGARARGTSPSPSRAAAGTNRFGTKEGVSAADACEGSGNQGGGGGSQYGRGCGCKRPLPVVVHSEIRTKERGGKGKERA